MRVNKYSNKLEYSYSLGAFPTIELLENRPEQIISIYIHSDWKSNVQKEFIDSFCRDKDIPIITNNKVVEKIRDKENCYVVGLFRKYCEFVNPKDNHVVLVNPRDMGNVGTIIRTCLGFNIYNIAVIKPCIDIFHPKVIRASMGAVFKVNIGIYDCFEEYRIQNPHHEIYPFMLKGKYNITEIKHDKDINYSLVFGNEAKGLDDSFFKVGKSVFISHSDNIDSLNLSLAVGIGVYDFQNQYQGQARNQ